MLVQDDFSVEFLFGHVVALELVKRQVDSVSLNVFTNISQDVGQLHEDAPRLSVFSCHGVVVAVDFNAHQANDGGNSVAVNIEFVKGAVAVVVEVVLHARNQVVKDFSGDVVAVDGVLQRKENGVG